MASVISFLAVASLSLSSPGKSSIDYNCQPNIIVETTGDNQLQTQRFDFKDIRNDSTKSSANSLGQSITDIVSYLNTNHPSFYWIKNLNESAYTSDISGFIPIEMQSSLFPESDVLTAVNNSGAINYTDYGGCGPIAVLGILDYFNRYFVGFDEYFPSPCTPDGRVELATKLFDYVNYFSILNNDPGVTFVDPIDCATAFNSAATYYGVDDMLSANAQFHLFGYDSGFLWDTITNNIDVGMPVTLMTGLFSGNGDFSGHYTNIYGYETWVGIDDITGEYVTKKFIKARLNWGDAWSAETYYCDADILNCPQIGLITYSLNYRNQYNMTAQSFSSFVNNAGQGQYFFYNRNEEIELPNGVYVDTNRLRTSFIENQYLVMPPNRINAGTAYLHFAFNHRVQKMTFTAALWSQFEGILYETFQVEYDDPDVGWTPLKTINLQSLSTNKLNPDMFTVYFPKQTFDVRFYANHTNPTSNKNKGRICLDDFLIEYFE